MRDNIYFLLQSHFFDPRRCMYVRENVSDSNDFSEAVWNIYVT